MNPDKLVEQITCELGFEPTIDQASALQTFARFITVSNSRTAMILRGSAGTGKTSLAGAIVRASARVGIKVVLLAPTGRAAKVFSRYSGAQANTIHRRIYRERTFDGTDGVFELNKNLFKNALFMVDEASMISLTTISNSFGSGCLLDDLMQFIYSGQNCRLLLIGDKAQLPPVGEMESRALMASEIEAYGLDVYECDLNEVLRQSLDSGILWNATMIRELISRDLQTQLPIIHLKGFADISVVRGPELIEQIEASYSEVGIDETMIVTRSNKRANIFNEGIRSKVLWMEDEIASGDMLMVVKNKYLNQKSGATNEISFIANGDRAVVRYVSNVRELYGFRFADLTVELTDYDSAEFKLTAILDTLYSEAPALTDEQNTRLFYEVLADYADITLKRERMKRIREDIHYNALQVKFGYAVTCHKAQGGQWAHVYLDQGYMTSEMLTLEYIHWLYTAFTRATEHLYLVNWPDNQLADLSEQ